MSDRPTLNITAACPKFPRQLALAGLLLSHSAGAQSGARALRDTSPMVHIGDTLRLSVRDFEIARGTLMRVDSGGVLLRRLAGADTQYVAHASYGAADVLAGRAHAGNRSISLGALVGAGVAGVANVAGTRSASASVGQALLGAVVGSAVGAVISGFTREVWRPVDVQAVRTEHVVARADPATADVGVGMPSRIARRNPRTPWLVAIGDTVRIFNGHDELAYGILLDADSAGLNIRDFAEGDTRRIGVESAARAEVKRGEHQRGLPALGTGTLIGTGIGGALIMLGVASHPVQDGGLAVAFAIVAGGASVAVGAVGGAIASLTWTDSWLPFDPRTRTLTLTSQ